MIRLFDIMFSLVGGIILSPLIIVLLIVGYFDTGSPLFLQRRIGLNKKIFTLIKFRTMSLDAPSVASHLASVDDITVYGKLLRRSKLDELPQLWNVLKGEMSLVGPRPCLSSQFDLILERDKRGVFNVKPGITGLAQIKEIDMSTPQLLAEIDSEMIAELNIFEYIKYIAITLFGRGMGDRIRE